VQEASGCQLFARDREIFWKPPIAASAVLDSLNWTKNALRQFHLFLGKLTKEQRLQGDATVSGFHLADCDDAKHGIVELEDLQLGAVLH
jgi:hypothetical protein